MKSLGQLPAERKQRGVALVFTLLTVLLLTGIATATYLRSFAHNREVSAYTNQIRSLYLAEAAAFDGMASVEAALFDAETVPTSLGSPDSPLRLSGGRYWVEVQSLGQDRYELTATGEFMRTRRSVQALLEASRGALGHAVFAGNSSRDSSYVMEFGGTGSSGDRVAGSVYSGGDMDLTGDANVTGDLRAAGTITGGAGLEGASSPTIDLDVMAYETNHDYDVGALFGSATYTADDTGGSAYQLPESNPAHFLRKNPSDRFSATSSTPKDDYFIEDPYETVLADSAVTLAPGTGTDKIFYIDGNLWIHNLNMMGVQFEDEAGTPVRVVFAVRGNVYFSDNLYYEDATSDAVVFVALEDDRVPDSGNIYFGDTDFGTLDEMNAFMFAENDFIDNNFGTTGVTINGSMAAGNQVKIEREYTTTSYSRTRDGISEVETTVSHAPLDVQFDDRLMRRAVNISGLPQGVAAVETVLMVSFVEVAEQ